MLLSYQLENVMFIGLCLVQNQKLQMRLGGIQSRLVQVTQNQQLATGLAVGPRMGLSAPPPPPPPYPGPPPPYPGNKTNQQHSAHQHAQQVGQLLFLFSMQ